MFKCEFEQRVVHEDRKRLPENGVYILDCYSIAEYEQDENQVSEYHTSSITPLPDVCIECGARINGEVEDE